MARGLCFKSRPAIGRYPDGPMQPGEKYKLNVESQGLRADLRRGLPVQGRLRPVAGPRPAAALQPQPLPLQLALALGLRQRRHRQPGAAPVRHRALGPRRERAPGARSRSAGGLFGVRGTSQETPNVQTTLFTYADGKVLEFATRGTMTNDEGTQKIGNLFYGTKGWVWIDGDGRTWQSYLGRKDEKGPGASRRPERHGQRPERPHQHRVPALPELHRRHPRRRPQQAHLRRSRRATCPRPSPTSPTSPTASAAPSRSTARRRRSGMPRPTSSSRASTGSAS